MRRAGLAVVAMLATVMATAGCSSHSPSQSASSPTPATTTARMAIDQDFPDPDVLADGGRYYLFATNSPAYNIQLATSTDLHNWKVDARDALPDLPQWAQTGNTWAPAVEKLGTGSYLMYYTARDAASQRQCIGAARSATPAGPYEPVGAEPLVCDPAEGGDIDPYPFTDTDGKRYLLWKSDGNCCGLDTWIQVAPLTSDGLSLSAPPTKLIREDQSWEGKVVEAPTLLRHNGQYVLLYSANNYADDTYAIGWATASSISGPYHKSSAPLLSTASSKDRYLGPGGQDVVTAQDGQQYLVFHSWDPAYSYRGVNVLPLQWRGNAPTVP